MTDPHDDGPDLVSPKQLAREKNFNERTLEGYRYKGGGPPYYRISRSLIRYSRREFDLWLATRRRGSTSDPGPGGSHV